MQPCIACFPAPHAPSFPLHGEPRWRAPVAPLHPHVKEPTNNHPYVPRLPVTMTGTLPRPRRALDVTHKHALRRRPPALGTSYVSPPTHPANASRVHLPTPACSVGPGFAPPPPPGLCAPWVCVRFCVRPTPRLQGSCLCVRWHTPCHSSLMRRGALAIPPKAGRGCQAQRALCPHV